VPVDASSPAGPLPSQAFRPLDAAAAATRGFVTRRGAQLVFGAQEPRACDSYARVVSQAHCIVAVHFKSVGCPRLMRLLSHNVLQGRAKYHSRLGPVNAAHGAPNLH
jgi:hypothetical protein